LWRHRSAGGYSEVAVSGDRAVTMDLRDGLDVVIAFDAATGRTLWSSRLAPTYRGHNGSQDGPIATPTIDGNQVFAVGPHGAIAAFDLVTGGEQWRHDLRAMGAAMPEWGFAASPLVEGRLVIVPAGGRESPGVLAFDRGTGRQVWSAGRGGSAGYSSAVAATIDGARHIVVFRGDRVFAVAPSNGQELWSIPGSDPNLEVLNSPIRIGERSFLLTHARESALISIARKNGRFSATEVWRTARFRGAVGPMIHYDGFLYGFSGPQLICVDAGTGEIQWRERLESGTLAGAGGQLFVLGERTGDLRVVQASPERYRESSRQRVFTPDVTSLTGPSIANGRLYVRNTREIAAFELDF
jgi:outer membrane protein assembly factor BamB